MGKRYQNTLILSNLSRLALNVAGEVERLGWPHGSFIAIAKSSFRSGKPYNPPCPPLKRGENCKELLLKSPFKKGGVRGI
jgi:hypothetical protein